MKEFRTRGKSVQVPESIEELTPEQYRYYLVVTSALLSKAITPDYFCVRWLSYLIGLGEIDFVKLRQEYIDEIESQVDAVLDGFLKMVDGELRPVLECCRNLWPECDGHKGPGDWLDGMTYGKAVECLTSLEIMNGNPEAADDCADHIARIMYGYSPNETINPLLVQHSLLFFSSVWKAIESTPILINGRMIDFSIIFKQSGKTRPDDKTGWTGITFEVASAGIFGTVKEVEAAGLWEVLMYLYKCKFESEHDKTQKA